MITMELDTKELEDFIKQAIPIIDNASVVVANELKKLAKPYTPYRSGDLERSLKFVYQGRRVVAFLYDVEYATKMWYGSPNWNYNTTVNRQACPRWLTRAWSVHGDDIVNNVNKDLKYV